MPWEMTRRITHKAHKAGRWLLAAGIAIAVLLLAVRLYLDVWLLDYVNNVLSHINGYQGSVQSINIDLYRGAYQINRLVLNKMDAGIPAPFVSIEHADLSIQWRALLHGRIVSTAELTKPAVNFAVNEGKSQTGSEVDWTQPIKKLMPIDINHVILRDGKVSYQDFSSTPRVDLYIKNVNGDVENLRNVEAAGEGLPPPSM